MLDGGRLAAMRKRALPKEAMKPAIAKQPVKKERLVADVAKHSIGLFPAQGVNHKTTKSQDHHAATATKAA